MDKNTAISIIRSLANGLDPFSGKQCANESVLQNAETVRALFYALSAIIDQDASLNLAQDGSAPVPDQQDTIHLWQEYCEVVQFENPHSQPHVVIDEEHNEEEYFETDDAQEYYYEEEDSYERYDKDYEGEIADIRQEMLGSMEDYARSEEEGWYYPNSEGSWEDNLVDED